MSQLEAMARDLDVSARTLRRAVASGLLRATPGRAPGAPPLAAGEEAYARRLWPVLGVLRAALRTEAGVECAILFGSLARGDDTDDSDVDLLVGFRAAEPLRAAALAGRLEARVVRRVHVVSRETAERAPILLDDVIREGRPLVDRRRAWPVLRARAGEVAAAAIRADRELAGRAERALDAFLGRA